MLNFLGLGFSFGAKDKGLHTQAKRAGNDISNIVGEIEKMGRKAESGTTPVSHMVDQLSGSSMDKLTSSIDKLSVALGENLPKASKRGADAMHRGADDLENDERK